MVVESKSNPGPKAPGSGQKKTTKKKTTRKRGPGREDTADNRNESAGSSTAASSGSPAVPAAAVHGQGKSGGPSGISWVALCLGVAALGMGGYAWYVSTVQTKTSTQSQVSRISLLEQRVDNFDTLQADLAGQARLLKNQVTEAEDLFSNQLRTIRSELAEKDSRVQQQIRNAEKGIQGQVGDFRREFETLSGSMVQLRSELGRGLDRWVLEEVEQLLTIANQRLQFAGDPILAKKALQAADDRLRERGDPRFLEVRRLLAGEISELEKIRDVDIAGVLSAISVLSDTLGELDLTGDLHGPARSGPERNGPESGESDRQSTGTAHFFQPVVDAATALLASLGDMIQVEKHGEAVNPVISAEIRQLIYTKGRLILDSSQIAFLRQNPELFEERIALAREWVEENFDLESETTQRWLSGLDEIASRSPRPALPDLSGSLNLLRQIMREPG
ncbi:MAG: uroporphyrinogen-III C-methyltransferase [Gammaproteobacteria bacterium]|nr:uroporphyrinogen-III C-methyltransferase [Gammaproteobacteria bacterium]